jgi:hypothetical protein
MSTDDALAAQSAGPVLMQEHTGALVMPGVTLSEGSVLGALSLLTKTTEP